MFIEPNGLCQWCDVPHGGHQSGCPAGDLADVRTTLAELRAALVRDSEYNTDIGRAARVYLGKLDQAMDRTT